MQVRLLRDARINHKAGEVVEVSPEVGAFLLSVNSAVMLDVAVEDAVETAEVTPKPRKKATKTKKG